ncbi:MAG: hypothetical protein IJM25_05790 [Eubacterium sp.]|nr:hypothetical protein [Eubacterium sp.]
MNRETTFESNVKWFVMGFAGLTGLCHLILLFTEFTFFKSAGMLFNGIYHLAGVLCPVLIIFLLIKRKEDKEVYSCYSIGILGFFGSVAGICLLVKYIIDTNSTDGLQIWLTVLISILAVFEIVYAVVFIKFGLDKVTSVLPLLLTGILVIMKGCIYNAVDSRFKTYAHDSVEKTIFSVWTLMYLFAYLGMIICLVLYLDSGFLQELFHNPKEWFSKKALFGTYSNLYLKTDIPTTHITEASESKKLNRQGEQYSLSNQNNMTGLDLVITQSVSYDPLLYESRGSGNLANGDVLKSYSVGGGMKMKKAFSIIGMIMGLALMGVGIYMFLGFEEKYIGYSPMSIKFGGDYYTEQYAVTRHVADNVNELGEFMEESIGFGFKAGGLIVALLGGIVVCFFACKAAENNMPPVQLASRITNSTPPKAESDELPEI